MTEIVVTTVAGTVSRPPSRLSLRESSATFAECLKEHPERVKELANTHETWIETVGTK